VRYFRFRPAVVLALALLAPLGAASKASAKTADTAGTAATGTAAPAATADATRHHARVDSVTIRCVGDTLTGVVQARGKSGEVLTLNLLERQRDGGKFVPTGRTAQVTLSARNRSRNRYSYHIGVGGLNARAYQVTVRPSPRASLVRSPVVSAAECAPSPVVPEAALPILLPASMLAGLAAAGAVVTRRARRTRRSRRSDPQLISS